MPRIRKPEKEKVGSFFRRAGWLSLTVLFIVTGLGVGVVAFWQATHQPASDSSQTPQTADTCTEGAVSNVETLALPTIYKTTSPTTKLQSTDLHVGTGQAAKDGDCLVMKYYGTLATSGTEFDENFDKPAGFQFKLGAGQVISGWDQGLVGIKVGGTRRLVIPASLGYGAQGSPPTIPANSDLVFVVKLESIK